MYISTWTAYHSIKFQPPGLCRFKCGVMVINVTGRGLSLGARWRREPARTPNRNPLAFLPLSHNLSSPRRLGSSAGEEAFWSGPSGPVVSSWCRTYGTHLFRELW